MFTPTFYNLVAIEPFMKTKLTMLFLKKFYNIIKLYKLSKNLVFNGFAIANVRLLYHFKCYKYVNKYYIMKYLSCKCK